MDSASQTVSYSFWVDQTDSLSMTVSSLAKNLSIALVGPEITTFTFGQSISGQFQSFINPDPLLVPDAVGANYHLDLTSPVKGQWTIRIQSPSVMSSPLTLPLRIGFNNQVAPVLFGGGNGPVGKPVPFSLAVMDGTIKVNSLQISAMLYGLDDLTAPPVPVTFADDGQGVDNAAGDSIYSAFVVPDQSGRYMLQVEVSGDASTGHFQRSISSGFMIVPKTGSITGNFTIKSRVGIPK
jgi:hypothetical protein